MSDFYFNQLKRAADEAFTETMRANSPLLHQANDLVLSFNSWFYYDYSQGPPSIKLHHPIISDLLMGITNSIESSYFLALNGLYDAANSELRNTFDRFLIRIYFFILDIQSSNPTQIVTTKLHNGFEYKTRPGNVLTNCYYQWLKDEPYNLASGGPCYSPRIETRIKEFLKVISFSKYNSQFNIVPKINELYKRLSKWTHGRPQRNYLRIRKAQSLLTPRYVSEELVNWNSNINDFYDLFSQIFILVVPEMRSYEEWKHFKRRRESLWAQLEQVLSTSP